VYLREGFYVLPSRKSAKYNEIFEKIRTRMGNNNVGKKVYTPKVNTWVNTFLLLALGFYVNPMQVDFGKYEPTDVEAVLP